jgi:hypothetical protein
MRRRASLFLISSLVIAGGCSQPATNQTPPQTNQTAAASPAPGQTNAVATATPAPAAQSPAPKGDVDPCSLLTSAELQTVQGEPLKETKSSGQAAGGLLNLQCLYTLPTFSNSVSLSLTEKDPSASGGRTAKQYWQEIFHGRETARREGGREAGEKNGKEAGEKNQARGEREAGERGEEEEGSARPEAVRGLGDEAFWTASRVGGALYVLKGERFFMVSVGGKGDEESKLKKAKTLAQSALRRL